MKKLKLISDYKCELMAIIGWVGAMCADHKILFLIFSFIFFMGLVGMTAHIIAIIIFKKLVLFFEKLVEKKYSNEK